MSKSDEERLARISAFHDRLVALVKANVDGLPFAKWHDLAGDVAHTFAAYVAGDKSAPSDAELLSAIAAGAPKYLPKAAPPGPRLDPAAVYANQKARDWEKAMGEPPPPGMMLAWVREAPTYRPVARDKPRDVETNRAVADAMARYERDTGRSRHDLLASQQIEIANRYAQMDAAPSTPTIDEIAKTNRTPTPTERLAMAREAEAAEKDAAA